MKLRAAEPRDHTFISVLVTTAFGRPEEARLIEALRGSGDMAMELVAEDEDGQLLGHIAFSRLSQPAGWWALAPVCVVRSRQRQGVGGKIIRGALDLARQARARAVLVVGGAPYYSRFGFRTEAAANLETPYPKELTLAYPIAPGSAGEAGQVIYPEPFAAL